MEDEGNSTEREDWEWQLYQRIVQPATILRGIQNILILFPPTLNAARALRNSARERVLRVQVMGSASSEPAIPKEGQGHPANDRVRQDSPVILGPLGEHLWRLV